MLDERRKTAAGMAELVKNEDWSSTPLGARAEWSLVLRLTVDTMLASGHAMCLIWGPERVLLYNDGYVPVLGARHPAALGCPTAEVWPELWDQIAPLIDATFAGETCIFREQPLIMTRNGFEEQTWWDFTYSPVRDEHGAIVGLLNVTGDVTERVLAVRGRDTAIAELRESQRFMSSVLAASTDCIKVVELDGTLSFMSEGGMGVMEVSDFNAIKNCPWPDFLRADGPDAARAAIEAAKAGRTSHFEAPADTYLGNPKYWSISVSPIRGEEGQVERILSVSRDHTALHQAREQERLLNGELAHRIKNMLSVVQAIAVQTLGKVDDQAAIDAFTARLTALASAHEVLVHRSWGTTRFDEVTRSVLATFGEDRFTLAGPSVEIGPRVTLALSLMLHELATNAAKYGALSVPEGQVALVWGLRDDQVEQRLHLSWSERGGPPAVAPARRGFGSRIIRMGLCGSGGVDLRYGDQGLTMEASAPLHQVQEE